MNTNGTTALRVAASDLYRPCDPEALGFETTATVQPLDGTVGQDRALSSLAFGLGIDAEGYNLFVAGPAGTGRNSTLAAVLQPIADARPRPSDLCYVHNFEDPRQPAAIQLEDGRGRAFAQDMARFVAACRRDIPRAFEAEGYSQRREELAEELQDERKRILTELDREAGERGFTVTIGPMGVATIPRAEDGQPMSREVFAQLPEELRARLQEQGEGLKKHVSGAVNQIQRLDRTAQQRFEELDESVVVFTITPHLEQLQQTYADHPKIAGYLRHVMADILASIIAFRATDVDKTMMPFMQQQAEEFFTRYEVNVIVGREESAGAPVVIENNPTYYNLFGRVDYRSQLGAMTTDHMMIKAGALHRANGGYLVLQALDVLTNLLVWETLKRTVRSRQVRIENLGEQYSAIPVATLNPQPIPLKVKLVLIGSPLLYHLLFQADEDFRKLFRVKADFTVDMERSPDCVGLYAGFISSCAREQKLRSFHKSAVARIVEHGSRLVEHQGRLSTRFIEISDLLTEANFWAEKEPSDLVYDRHIDQAIEHKVYRSNLIEERLQRLIEDGTIFIETRDAVVGQVNGIAVYELGDYRFGRPSRITARTSLGRGQVVSIEREIQMSGKLHSKGFAIVNGYLHGKYAQERPLALTASIGFEQTYDEVDGDSASSAELYALVSALAGAPVRQGIAVTGSADQRGDVQPIGGVNEKIEGFFAVCKTRGLTGDQGMIIPRTNVQHLMLRKDVVDAVREGRFHVWAIDTVDQGIEVLTGVPAGEPDSRGRYPPGTINRLVMDELAKLARRAAARPRRRAASHNGDNANERKNDQPPTT